MLEVKSLYQKRLAFSGNDHSQELTALQEDAFSYSMNTPRVQSYAQQLTRGEKPRPFLPPERHLWIEHSTELQSTPHQQRGDRSQYVQALWFWFVDAPTRGPRWRLDLIDREGQGIGHYIFFAPSHPSRKISLDSWTYPHSHYGKCGMCSHREDHAPGHDLDKPCITLCQMCKDDLLTWKSKLCIAIELIQQNKYRSQGRFFL